MEEEAQKEWIRYKIILPADDFDEDDEIDARIEMAAKRQKNRVSRGFDIRGV